MNILCKIFGHKPKEYEPVVYWIDSVGPVPSKNIPLFCKRCGEGELEMIIDTHIKGLFEWKSILKIWASNV